VYIFDLATGEQLMRIHQPDGTEFDLFGGSVALHGDRLVVGAPDSGESFSRSGAAYLFDASSGELIRKLVPEDVDPGDYFGTAIAITEDYVVIGSPGDGDIAAWSGSAYLFDARTGDEIMKLVPSDGYTAFDFGESVAAEGGLAVIGAPGKTETLHGQGGAYLFDLQTGEQLGAWLASDAAEFDRFGGAVALSDSHAVIGARGSNVLGPNLNRAYVFDVRTGEEIATLFPKNGEAHEAFGASVTMTKSRAVVGVPGDDGVVENTGSAFLFDLSSLFGCPGDVNDDGLINLADLNIVLANFGTMGEIGDATGDGLVNLADLNTVLANFGGACE
jgi:outer membrane protein assembly factor BamB